MQTFPLMNDPVLKALELARQLRAERAAIRKRRDDLAALLGDIIRQSAEARRVAQSNLAEAEPLGALDT